MKNTKDMKNEKIFMSFMLFMLFMVKKQLLRRCRIFQAWSWKMHSTLKIDGFVKSQNLKFTLQHIVSKFMNDYNMILVKHSMRTFYETIKDSFMPKKTRNLTA